MERKSKVYQCSKKHLTSNIAQEIEKRILVFRFCNRMLLGSWNSQHIDYMRIIVDDIDQGMEILALLTMRAPKHLHDTCINRAKKRILRKIHKYTDNSFFINHTAWSGTIFYMDIAKSDKGFLIVYKPGRHEDDASKRNRIFFSIENNGGFYIDLVYKAFKKEPSRMIRLEYKPTTSA